MLIDAPQLSCEFRWQPTLCKAVTDEHVHIWHQHGPVIVRSSRRGEDGKAEMSVQIGVRAYRGVRQLEEEGKRTIEHRGVALQPENVGEEIYKDLAAAPAIAVGSILDLKLL